MLNMHMYRVMFIGIKKKNKTEIFYRYLAYRLIFSQK